MRRKSQVAIVVDSAASLPPDVGGEGQLYIVPMRIVIEGKTYLDGRDVSPATFYRMMEGLDEAPSTSAPSPADYLDAFREAAEEASSILCITVSPSFSSSMDSARTAVEMAKQALPGIQVVLLDSESAAGGEGLVALEALRVSRGGTEAGEVITAAKEVVTRVSLLAFLDTLYYVWKSGRVPRVAYAGTSLLQIKPLFEMSRGKIRTLARPRTARRATRRLVRLMHQRVGPGPVHAAVMHAHAKQEAEELMRRVEVEFQCRELFVSEFSPVMGTHTGPGLLGIAFWSERPGRS